MSKIPEFDLSLMERVSEVLAPTETGLTGAEIGKLFKQLGIDDAQPTMSKRVRLFEAWKE